MATLTLSAGEADADGDGLLVGVVEFVLLAGSTAQPATATIENAMTSASDVCLIRFMMEYLGYKFIELDFGLPVLLVTYSTSLFFPLGFGGGGR
jgi:hypothetical protein